MKKTFINNSLANSHKQLISETPTIAPVKGDIGGFSIEFTTGTDTVSHESITYRDELSRDADLEQLLKLLS